MIKEGIAGERLRSGDFVVLGEDGLLRKAGVKGGASMGQLDNYDGGPPDWLPVAMFIAAACGVALLATVVVSLW